MTRTTTDALLLRKKDHGNADTIVTFFTESLGTVSSIGFGARRSRKRFAVLDAFHTLRVELDDMGRDLCTLHAATVTEPRTAYLSSLEMMERASTALGWVRRVCPPRSPEPAIWTALVDFLNTTPGTPDDLAIFGLAMLRAAGLMPSSVRSGMTAREVIRAVEIVVTEQAGA